MKIGDIVIIPTGQFINHAGEVVDILTKVVMVQVGNLRVEVDRRTLEEADKAEAEIEANANRRPPIRTQKEEGEGRDPRNRKDNRPRSQTPPGDLPHETREVLTKREVTEMAIQPATQQVPRSQPGRRPLDEMESCPICGSSKPKEITPTRGEKYRPLTCKGCKDKYNGPYVQEVTQKLAAGETVEALSWHEWVLTQIDLARFAEELNEAFREKERLNGLVQTRLQASGHLPNAIFVSLRNKLQEEKLAGENGTAKAAYGKWRRLQERLKAATEVRPQVEKMVAEEAARNAPKAETTAVPVEVATAPAEVETPTEKTAKVPRKKRPTKAATETK